MANTYKDFAGLVIKKHEFKDFCGDAWKDEERMYLWSHEHKGKSEGRSIICTEDKPNMFYRMHTRIKSFSSIEKF